jgi:hypothetical protein
MYIHTLTISTLLTNLVLHHLSNCNVQVRTESKEDMLCTPFELSVNIICLAPPLATPTNKTHMAANDTPSDDDSDSAMRLRVSVEVGEYIVGITGEENTSRSAYRPSAEDQRKYPGHFVSWKDNMFQHPLISLSPHPIRFRVYRELVAVGGIESGCRGELVAWAQDDEVILNEMWRQPNKKTLFKISITPSHRKMGYLWVELELVEHSVLYFAGQVPRKPALPMQIANGAVGTACLGGNKSTVTGSCGNGIITSKHQEVSASSAATVLTKEAICETERMFTRHVLESICSAYRDRSDGVCVLDPAEVPAWLVKNLVMSNADLFAPDQHQHHHGSSGNMVNGMNGEVEGVSSGDAFLNPFEELNTLLLTLNRCDVRDVIDDISSIYSEVSASLAGKSDGMLMINTDEDRVHTGPVVYPFVSPLAYNGLLAYKSSTLDYPTDSGEARRMSIASIPRESSLLPAPRAVYDYFPLTLHMAFSDTSSTTLPRAQLQASYTSRLFGASVVTTSGRVYSFQWVDESSYLAWMFALSQCLRECVGDHFKQTLRTSYFNNMYRSATMSSRGGTGGGNKEIFEPVEFELIPSEGVLRCTKLDSSGVRSSSSNGSQSGQTSDGFYLALPDIDHITTDSTFDFSKRYLMEIEVCDLSVSGFRPGGDELAVVTVTSSSGSVDYAQFYYRDLHTTARRVNRSSTGGVGTSAAATSAKDSSGQAMLPRKMTMRLFISSDSITQVDDVLIALHICSEADGIKTVGERRVSLLDLVGESVIPKTPEEPSAEKPNGTGENTPKPTDSSGSASQTSLPGSNSSNGGGASPMSYLGVVAVEPKKMNKASQARASAAASAALQATATELCMNIQTARELPLNAPRDALM